METLRVEILNPKAKKLLRNLAELNLISIESVKDLKLEIKELLANLRNQSETPPSLEEITKEVELVRTLRYEKKQN